MTDVVIRQPEPKRLDIGVGSEQSRETTAASLAATTTEAAFQPDVAETPALPTQPSTAPEQQTKEAPALPPPSTASEQQGTAGRPSRRAVLGGVFGLAVAGLGGVYAFSRSREGAAPAARQIDPTRKGADAGLLTPEASANILGVETNPLYNSLTAAEKEIIDRLNGTPWGPAYFAYPIEERRLFAQFMRKGQEPYTRKQVAESHKIDRYVKPAPASETNTAQEIVDQWITTYTEISWSLTRNGSPTVNPAKIETALKTLFAIYDDPALPEDDLLRKVTLLRTQEAINPQNDGYERNTAMDSARTDKPERECASTSTTMVATARGK
ncbi:hypothetical protein IPL68_02825 [Candidatus Saccharibacteria bacterium]|nr:MAG: hypothetical protein IPL68_02825 [Candidatus Saccharibacteria bacterium]